MFYKVEFRLVFACDSDTFIRATSESQTLRVPTGSRPIYEALEICRRKGKLVAASTSTGELPRELERELLLELGGGYASK